MIVVSDTSPLNYLSQIGCLDVLPKLYGHILVPSGVIQELQNPAAPNVVRDFVKTLPVWITVRNPLILDGTIGLGIGEIEAISLAMELKADFILMDDRAAYRAAVARGLNAAGTLTVLAEAAARGFLNLDETVRKLRGTNFRVSEVVLKQLLDRGGR